MPRWQLVEGDALTVLPGLAAGSVGLVLADPPYNSGGRTIADRTTRTTRDKYVSGAGRKGTGHDLQDFAGDNRDQRGYVAWLSLILAECLRVTTPGGSLLVFSDWRQLPSTSDAIQAAGWQWRGILAWHKPINRPRLGGFRAECEYVLWASHGPIDAGVNPVYLPGLYSYSQPRGRDRQHITAKPVQLLRELVRICPPKATVLDPFAGSGSAGLAAMAEDRPYIGIEITPHYADIARQRLHRSELTLAPVLHDAHHENI